MSVEEKVIFDNDMEEKLELVEEFVFLDDFEEDFKLITNDIIFQKNKKVSATSPDNSNQQNVQLITNDISLQPKNEVNKISKLKT